jgi:hypothetical protein
MLNQILTGVIPMQAAKYSESFCFHDPLLWLD